MDKNYKLLIIGRFAFPFGSAASSRVRTLARGLNDHGFEVFVITNVSIPFRITDQTDTGELSWMGIKYETQNCYEQNGKKLSFVRRGWNAIKATYKSWYRVDKLLRDKSLNGIMVYGGRSVISYLPVVMLAWLYGVAIFYDVVEWFPYSKFRAGFINPLFYDDWLGRHLPFFRSQGVIAISNYILQRYARHNIPCLLLPSVFDPSLNPSQPLETRNSGSKLKEFVIIYAGSCKDGDGFENLLDAVTIAVSNGCPVRLDVLGTDGLSGMAAKQRKTVEKDETLHSRVRFLGKVSDEDYFSLLNSADCLVLPRPDCQIVRAAFPTRLPEFLSTGRPVLTTSVPDVPQYLEPGVHAEIVEKGTSTALAGGILRLWKEPERARKIGIAGREKGREVFDYRQHALVLSQFIIKNSKL